MSAEILLMERVLQIVADETLVSKNDGNRKQPE
jgi:hypothetical protein